MSIIKSFAVCDENGEAGDMFYIRHNSSNFTIIDCCMTESTQKSIINEIITNKNKDDILRFISTHPDEDHICGLKYLDDKLQILNFYCVENQATKPEPSESFKHYCQLRDGEKMYFVYKNCTRKWLNKEDETRGSSGISFLWPDTSNSDFKDAQTAAEEGKAYNNLSPIFVYKVNEGISAIWMGDLEADFLEKIKDEVDWPKVDVLYAPHHGRDSGKVPAEVLEKLDPKVIVIGEAPSKYLNYYEGYNTLKQNSAGDIVFECINDKVHVYVQKEYKYDTSFLSDEELDDSSYGYYLGSFKPRSAK